MATTFTFTNVTKTNRGGISADLGKHVSPTLAPSASDVLPHFNPVNAAVEDSKTSAKGFDVLIPVYGREQYITLPADTTGNANVLTVTVTDAITIAWYDGVMAAFGGANGKQVTVTKQTV